MVSELRYSKCVLNSLVYLISHRELPNPVSLSMRYVTSNQEGNPLRNPLSKMWLQ
jgi:hypothetical protein